MQTRGAPGGGAREQAGCTSQGTPIQNQPEPKSGERCLEWGTACRARGQQCVWLPLATRASPEIWAAPCRRGSHCEVLARCENQTPTAAEGLSLSSNGRCCAGAPTPDRSGNSHSTAEYFRADFPVAAGLRVLLQGKKRTPKAPPGPHLQVCVGQLRHIHYLLGGLVHQLHPAWKALAQGISSFDVCNHAARKTRSFACCAAWSPSSTLCQTQNGRKTSLCDHAASQT
jgi:hypothetical protein